MGEQNNIKKDSTFDFCDKEFKSFKEDVLCSQDDLHKSMQDNSVGFVIFYVVAIIFVAALFQLSTKDFSKKVMLKFNLYKRTEDWNDFLNCVIKKEKREIKIEKPIVVTKKQDKSLLSKILDFLKGIIGIR